MKDHRRIPIEITVVPERPSPDVLKVFIFVKAVVEGTCATRGCLTLPLDDGHLGLVTPED